MRKFDRNRTRLLVVCKDRTLSNELVTLLTGYGYYVDYVSSRKDGILKFKQHNQAIILFDAELLPRFPRHLFLLFRTYMSDPKIIIIARPEQEEKVYPYLNNGVYDIIQVPLRFEYLDFSLRRLVAYDKLTARYEFFMLLTKLSLLSSPLWIYFIVVVAGIIGK
ncbi:MAG: response regulator transcription factor [Fibrobacter sp.]|nr:response regulator transcription factor [Fibrobacter sp.]